MPFLFGGPRDESRVWLAKRTLYHRALYALSSQGDNIIVLSVSLVFVAVCGDAWW